MNKPPTLERILMIRLSALGDCMVALPVFHALRKAYPKAHIAWAIQDNFAPLLQTLPGLDEVIIFPRARWRKMESKSKSRREAFQFIRHVRLRKFQAAIDIQSNTKSAGIAWLSGAPLRIGHGPPENKEISAWLNNRKVSPPEGMEHIVYRNLNLLTALNIQPATPNFDLPVNQYASTRIKTWLNENGLTAKQFTLLVPYSGDVIKEWPAQNYITLASILSNNNQKVVFLCGPGKEETTAQMVEQAQHPNTVLGPQTTIPEMIELVRLSGCAVGSDTGPLQIAGAFKQPTVALFGPTDPKRSHPFGACSVTHLSTKPEQVSEQIMKHLKEKPALI